MKLTKILILLSISLFIFTCDKTAKNTVLSEDNIVTCDDCGVCDTDSNNNNITCIDCSGELNGDHEFDECNICDDYFSNGGLKPEYPYGDCDCAGKTIQIDIDGNSIGYARLDDCDVCNLGNVLTGPYSFSDIDCEDCNGDLGGDAYKDGCGDCVGGTTGMEPCELDCNDETIITNLDCSSYTDEIICEEADGCTFSTDSICIQKSYASYDNCGNCVTEVDEHCIQVCDCEWSNDKSIPLEYPLCIALQNCQTECNNSENTECILIESAYYCVEYENWNDIDCAGACVLGTPKNDSYYMYCSTTGSTFTELNYELCIQNGCIGGECLLFDHDINSNANLDECGICSGGITGHEENSDKDCTGICFGEAFIDYCDSCVGGNTEFEACPTDCAGDPNGDATEDMCGICDNDPSNDCIQDCYGDWGGTGILDDCIGECVQINSTTFTCVGGGNNSGDCSQNGDSDCIGMCRESISDTDFNTTCEQDCAGIWAGENILDDCGVCDSNTNNDNDTCTDCAGVANGNHVIDECNICDDYSDFNGSQPSYPYGDCGCFDETANNFWCNVGGQCNQDCVDLYNINSDLCTSCKEECISDGTFINPSDEDVDGLYTNIESSCEYWGCSDETATNYEIIATNCEGEAVGVFTCCEYLGCTDENAVNYDPVALIDDGTCNNFLFLSDESNGTYNVKLYSTQDVFGFQFDISGIQNIASSGGVDGINGFTVTATGNTVIAFSLSGTSIPSIPYDSSNPTPELLTILTFDIIDVNIPICITEIVMSGEDVGTSLDFEGNCITITSE